MFINMYQAKAFRAALQLHLTYIIDLCRNSYAYKVFLLDNVATYHIIYYAALALSTLASHLTIKLYFLFASGRWYIHFKCVASIIRLIDHTRAQSTSIICTAELKLIYPYLYSQVSYFIHIYIWTVFYPYMYIYCIHLFVHHTPHHKISIPRSGYIWVLGRTTSWFCVSKPFCHWAVMISMQ